MINVSVIIPAYNASATLAETVESLLAQTCPHWEALIVDDGSDDDTVAVAKGLTEKDARLRVIERGPDLIHMRVSRTLGESSRAALAQADRSTGIKYRSPGSTLSHNSRDYS